MEDTSRGLATTAPWTAARTWFTGSRRWLTIAVLTVVALLLLLGGVAFARAGEALPGVYVEGVHVGGMGEPEIRDVVNELVADRQGVAVEVHAGDETFTFTPGARGYAPDVDATVEAALDAGRGGPLSAIVSHVRTTFGATYEVDLDATTDDTVVREFVRDVAATVNRPMSTGGFTVDPATLEVGTEPAVTGLEVDVAAAVEQLTGVIGDPSPTTMTLPVAETPAPTDNDDVAAVAQRAEAAVAAPLTVTTVGGTATFTPTEIARFLTSDVRDDTLVLGVDTLVFADVVADHRDALEVEPRDARFEVVSGLATFDDQGDATWSPRPAQVDVIPSEGGFRIDVDDAARQVAALLDAGRHEGELELTPVEASLTTAEAEALGIDQLIGTFTTYHACCQNRVTNIQRLADLVRGTVLRPGEEFSINEDVGRRTVEKGFVADGAIFNGEIRDEIGGGVSQFATTMFNASFFAGIPILEHRAHSLYISRYPLGREATLNYPSIDLKIENDTDHGIYIHTSYTSTSITVSLFGDNGGREVSAVMGQPYNHRGYEVRRRANPALPRGVEQVTQSGTQGYDVRVVRVIRENGSERTEEFFTRYSPRPQIVEVGTGEPPPPPPPPPSEDDRPSERPTEPADDEAPSPTANAAA